MFGIIVFVSFSIVHIVTFILVKSSNLFKKKALI